MQYVGAVTTPLLNVQKSYTHVTDSFLPLVLPCRSGTLRYLPGNTYSSSTSHHIRQKEEPCMLISLPLPAFPIPQPKHNKHIRPSNPGKVSGLALHCNKGSCNHYIRHRLNSSSQHLPASPTSPSGKCESGTSEYSEYAWVDY